MSGDAAKFNLDWNRKCHHGGVEETELAHDVQAMNLRYDRSPSIVNPCSHLSIGHSHQEASSAKTMKDDLLFFQPKTLDERIPEHCHHQGTRELLLPLHHRNCAINDLSNSYRRDLLLIVGCRAGNISGNLLIGGGV